MSMLFTKYHYSLLILFVLVALGTFWRLNISNLAEKVEDKHEDNDDEFLVLSKKIEHESKVDHSSGRSNHTQYLIDALFAELGNSQGPIIVGGIGDSGTRGVRLVLQGFGVNMLSKDYINPVSKDSEIFMGSYEVTLSNKRRLKVGPSALYNPGIIAAHSLKYGEVIKKIRPETWNIGQQYVAKMTKASFKVSKSEKVSKGLSIDPWGFKHPRTALMLPYFYATLQTRFKFVHVLRDGKDVAFGDNNRLFREGCERYYGEKCPNTLFRRILFWSHLNQEIYEWGIEHLGPDHYLPIRVEDLVSGNKDCFEQLARFVGSAQQEGSNFDDMISAAIKANEGHNSSYFGNHWSQEQKHLLASLINNNETVINALDIFGYGGAEDYSIKGGCLRVPSKK